MFFLRFGLGVVVAFLMSVLAFFIGSAVYAAWVVVSPFAAICLCVALLAGGIWGARNIV